MSKKIKTVYFVRGGTHAGAYLKRRQRATTESTRAYAWTNRKSQLCEMTYDQARNCIRQTYGGTLVKRVYKNDEVVLEAVVR
jgi:hypothetical protein